jgi:hypothetical protein
LIQSITSFRLIEQRFGRIVKSIEGPMHRNTHRDDADMQAFDGETKPEYGV